MPYIFKLRKRLSLIRAFAVAAAVVSACTTSDQSLTSPDSSTAQRRSSGSTVASVTVSPPTATGTVGQTVQFTATAYNAYGNAISAGAASWSTSNASIVSVSGSGFATASAAGQATITATINGVHGSAQATVTGGTQTVTNPGTVTDLTVSSVADTTATLAFTQVNDGTGKPASYEVRYAIAPISWGAAATVAHGTCASPILGTAIAARLSCTVSGLVPSTAYNFQIVAFRGTLNVNAVFGALSAVVAATTTSGTIAPPPPPPATNVLFQENFDDASFASRGWYDNTSVQITNADAYPAGGSSLVYHWPVGATTPANGGAIRHKFTASNSVYISYNVKYSANWVGSAHTYHPHEIYVLSSWDGDWDGLSNNWLTLYLEHNYQNGGMPRMAMQDNKSVNTLLGQVPLSLISVTENRSTGGCNGIVEANMPSECYNAPPWYNDKKLTGPVVFQPNPGTGYKNNWNRVEAYYQLNTIVNGVGQANGVMQYWFNGSLIIDRHDIMFFTGARAGLQLNQFVIAPYIGDGSPVDQSIWIDNLVVATARGTTP